MVAPAAFDPAVHLSYVKPSKVITMKDLALDGGISPIAVTEPFPLFSPDGVAQLRRDILSPEVLDKFTVTSYLSPCQAREFTPAAAPFVHAAWRSPEVIAAVSEAAGIDLVPVMDLELGHVNYQLGQKGKDGLRETPVVPPVQTGHFTGAELERVKALAEADTGEGPDNNVCFHQDAYPFVCVLMLSDCSAMVGGETALKTGDGRIVKARGPGVGHCVVMQGREINHAALKAYNVDERITMVTSFRAKDPMLRDASVLKTIYPITKRNRLNYQWSVYRMKLLAARFSIMARELEEKKRASGDDDKDGLGGSEIVEVETMSDFMA
ncbi:hypothetical protein BMF94_6777 [Rhodotorula taiwanensis]|uniref:Fe2OG dioxygenase domain-containing protein n=1 Tax=Rhodotorula taiwanensis TaxID=741276 RepID=A0A2S5B083_9BASI|nr:hypothetical protein BMF94_6777 [Rhodotorula taiwanensis]